MSRQPPKHTTHPHQNTPPSPTQTHHPPPPKHTTHPPPKHTTKTHHPPTPPKHTTHPPHQNKPPTHPTKTHHPPNPSSSHTGQYPYQDRWEKHFHLSCTEVIFRVEIRRDTSLLIVGAGAWRHTALGMMTPKAGLILEESQPPQAPARYQCGKGGGGVYSGTWITIHVLLLGTYNTLFCEEIKESL